MEPLYTTQFAHTLDEHIKFNKALMCTKKNITAFLFLFIMLSIIPGAITYYINKNIILSITVTVIFIILILISFPISMKKTIERNYYSNKMIDSEISDYKFYETKFTETDSHGSVTLAYADLARIIETSTNFYLMIAENQGYLILKSNCSPELITFLSELKNKIH